jgi:CDP-diacylglycerol pyrophosphatase
MSNDKFLLPVILIVVICASIIVIVYFSAEEAENMRQIIIDRRNTDVDNLATIIGTVDP